MSKLRLLQESTEADKAWMAEVRQVFGDREAGMARFHGRATGEPGSRLRELYDRYVKARRLRSTIAESERCLAPARSAKERMKMSALSVVSVADRAGFHIFASALRSSDYSDHLEGAGPFTVFAPTDAAFATFSKAALDKLLHDDRDHLHLLLGYHIAAGKVATARLTGKRIRGVMQAGGDVIIDGRSGLRVNAARLIKPDLAARNGIVHGIDALLAPQQTAVAAI